MRIGRFSPSGNMGVLPKRKPQAMAMPPESSPTGGVKPYESEEGPAEGTDEWFEMMDAISQLIPQVKAEASALLPSVPLRGQPVNDAGAQRRGLHDDYSGSMGRPAMAPVTPVQQLMQMLGIVK